MTELSVREIPGMHSLDSDQFHLLCERAEAKCERVSRLAMELFDVPIAQVNLIARSRRLFAAPYVLEAEHDLPPGVDPYSAEAILHVSDTLQHPRFRNHPLVTGATRVRMYCSVPLLKQDGEKFGSLCLIDTEPHVLQPVQLERLRDLADLIQDQLESDLVREKALLVEEHENQLRAVVDNVLDGIITIDSKGFIETFNPAAERIFGYSKDEALHRNLNKLLLQPFDFGDMAFPHDHLACNVEDFIGYGQELEGRHKNGSTFSLELSVGEMDIQGERKYVGIVRDITEQKLVQLERARYQAIVETSDDAIISKTMDGTVTSWNAGAEHMFGFTADEILGRSILKLFPPTLHAEEERLMSQLMLGEHVDHFETLRQHKDGTVFPISVSCSPIFNKHGKVVAVSKIARDISERKRGDAAKSHFLANMSHELRTPLIAIIGYSEILAEQFSHSKNRDAGKKLEKIHDSGQELLAIVNNIMDFTKLEAESSNLDLHAFSLREFLYQLGDAIAGGMNENQNKLSIVCDDNVGEVVTDPTILADLLLALLNNAAKFTHAGVVRLEARLNTSAEPAQLEIQVIDTGIGIPASCLTEIFAPFVQIDHSTTRAYGGVGLGLALVKKYCELLVGSVKVESQLGVGSTFCVTVPDQRGYQ